MTAPAVLYVECPRDSWQGLHALIPTSRKVEYLRALLDAGFTHLDLGSFVSARAVPQLADTEEVLSALPDPGGRDYLCIIANERGLERALTQDRVTSVGFPLSVSDAFQRRNTGRGLEDAWTLLKALADGARQGGRRLVVYLSMGFGNPDGEPWTPQHTLDAVARARDLGIQDVALSDTVGRAAPALVGALSGLAVARFGPAGLGVHLHARPEHATALVRAAQDAGIRWFEGALGGIGGCPFAGDTLTGNLPTEALAAPLNLPYRDLSALAQRARQLAAQAT